MFIREKIDMERKKGTYIIKVDFSGAQKKQKVTFDDGGRRAMDIGAMSEEEVSRQKNTVFQRPK